MQPTWTPHTPSEHAKAWRTSVFDDLEVLHASYRTHAFPRHVHEEFCIGAVVGGMEKIEYRGATHFAPVGSLVVIQPGEVHSNRAANDNGWSYKVFYPGIRLLQQVNESVSTIPFFPEPVIQNKQLFKELLRFHTLIEQSESNRILEKEFNLLMILKLLSRQYSSNSKIKSKELGCERRVVRQVKDYLHENYTQNPSLQEMASFTGLSPYYVTRVFCNAVGLPPHAYLTHLRISRAKQLLTQVPTSASYYAELSNLSIAQIATDLGFTDQSHFTKTFKTIVGVTPGQYRHYTQSGLRHHEN